MPFGSNPVGFGWQSMGALTYLKFDVSSGVRYTIEARIDDSVDHRGWTCDDWGTHSGPEGVAGYYVGGSLGHPGATIGMLIAAISDIETDGPMNWDRASQIFSGKSTNVGNRAEIVSPIDGYLYLICNDIADTADNHGAALVQVY